MAEQVATQSFDVPALADDTLLQVAERAEKRIDAVNKIKMLALRVTGPRDWVDQGGKPYLQSSGGEKVARLFGISWTISEPKLEQEEGGHFSYTYTGVFSLSGASIEAVGTRSSKDGFFKKYDYSQKDGNGASIKTELPSSEIDKGDVKKSAFTNLIGNGITRLLGIRNLTWEDLAAAGITREGAGKVDYKKGGQKKEDIKTEGALEFTGDVTDVRKSSGVNKKTQKPWTSYKVICGETEFGTFSETFALVGTEARDSAQPVKITYKTGQYGNEIEAITIVLREGAE